MTRREKPLKRFKTSIKGGVVTWLKPGANEKAELRIEGFSLLLNRLSILASPRQLLALILLLAALWILPIVEPSLRVELLTILVEGLKGPAIYY